MTTPSPTAIHPKPLSPLDSETLYSVYRSQELIHIRTITFIITTPTLFTVRHPQPSDCGEHSAVRSESSRPITRDQSVPRPPGPHARFRKHAKSDSIRGTDRRPRGGHTSCRAPSGPQRHSAAVDVCGLCELRCVRTAAALAFWRGESCRGASVAPVPCLAGARHGALPNKGREGGAPRATRRVPCAGAAFRGDCVRWPRGERAAVSCLSGSLFSSRTEAAGWTVEVFFFSFFLALAGSEDIRAAWSAVSGP